MSRDWQKDMELGQQAKDWEFYITFDGCGDIEENGSTIASDVGVSQADTIFNVLEALPYWLQQYAAEVERADQLQQELEMLRISDKWNNEQLGKWREYVRQTNVEIGASEFREQKLKELITEVLGDTFSLDYLNREKTQRLVEGYSSLYPKEGTK